MKVSMLNLDEGFDVYWRHRFVLEEEMNVRSGAAPQSDVIR
jgi:hypothetical protein